jgi:hypothetical protein
MVAQDLTDYSAEAWKLIQKSQNHALRRFDKVFCLSIDGTWAVEARVDYAEGERVVLTKPTVIQLPDPVMPAFTAMKIMQLSPPLEPFPDSKVVVPQGSSELVAEMKAWTPSGDAKSDNETEGGTTLTDTKIESAGTVGHVILDQSECPDV